MKMNAEETAMKHYKEVLPLYKRAIAKQIFDEIFQDILESPEQENWKKLPIMQKYLKLLYKDFEKLKSKYLDCK